MALGVWTPDMRAAILKANGSVQGLDIPDDVKQRYKTVWEISQKVVMDLARDRAPFVCQTQSMNLFKAAPTLDQLSSMHFYAWKAGLKTGMYYLRTLPKVQTDQFALEKSKPVKPAAPDHCESCSA
jgi:ribonucleotide reductase alpha subunit